ncbi:ornithine decarboxylase-like isoform X1 [Dermacentor variabilis]|uniref:ornithine decarboxylase-like isoform X1 n=1 Tax=Dermacentor variabilis TaxID=34621 RepID=UPI003F5BFBF2
MNVLSQRILLASLIGARKRRFYALTLMNKAPPVMFNRNCLLSCAEPSSPYQTDDGCCIYTEGSMHDVARDIISKRHTDPDAFFVCDLRDIAKKVNLWQECLPRIEPFYAIKSCRDPVVLNVLNNLSVGFDCGNKSEISAVLNMGVSPARIVLANAIKGSWDIEFALKHNVTLMAFDSVEELSKVEGKNTRLLLRILADEEGSIHKFNNKFGCSINDAKRILKEARARECNVVGVSFHVGSAYELPEIFNKTIEKAKAVFELAESMGIYMTVLDIGGGFPGGLRKLDKFVMVCENIRSATDLHFPPSSGVKLIAEPGQFFITSCYALVVQVIGKRRRDIVVDGISQAHQDVFINESRDNCVSRHIYEFLDVGYWPLQEPLERPHDQMSTIWGGTCNPMDCIEKSKPLFDVRVGEWLLMDNTGAYALNNATGFNGVPFPAVHYIVPQDSVSFVRRILDASPLISGYSQPENALKKALLDLWKAEAAKRNSRITAPPSAAGGT